MIWRKSVFLPFLWFFLQIPSIFADVMSEKNLEDAEKSYAKVFQIKRKGAKEILAIIGSQDKYENQYKMIESSFNKILETLDGARTILMNDPFDPAVDVYPAHNLKLVNAIAVILENTCLMGEIILHMPDMSYRVLGVLAPKLEINWKDLINWCLEQTTHFNDRILDKNSQALISLVNQEINPERRTADYINPYRSGNIMPKEPKKKKTKTVKKGPQMAYRDEF